MLAWFSCFFHPIHLCISQKYFFWLLAIFPGRLLCSGVTIHQIIHSQLLWVPIKDYPANAHSLREFHNSIQHSHFRLIGLGPPTFIIHDCWLSICSVTVMNMTPESREESSTEPRYYDVKDSVKQKSLTWMLRRDHVDVGSDSQSSGHLLLLSSSLSSWWVNTSSWSSYIFITSLTLLILTFSTTAPQSTVETFKT